MKTIMDRTYGVSASELRGDSYNREEVERRNAMNKANKESREFNKIVEYTSEVALFANELKQNVFSNLSDEGKSALASVALLISPNFSKEQKIMFLCEAKIDTANLKVKNLKEIQGDILGFLSSLEEVVAVAGSNNLISKTSAFQDLNKALSVKVQEKRIEKYMNVASGMDRKTVQTLVKKGLLK